MPHWDTLTAEQQALLRVEEEDREIRALDEGIRRFRNQNASQAMSKWPACRAMIAAASEEMTTLIEAERDKMAEGRGMRGALGWGPVFMYVDPEVLAVATLVAVLDCLTAKPDGSSIASVRDAIGSRIMMETHFTILKKEAPRLKRVMERRIKKWDRRTLRRAMSRIEDDCANVWTKKQKALVGEKLLALVLTTGLFTKEVFCHRPGRYGAFIRLAAEARKSIAKLNEHLEILTPMYSPMVCPPNDWAPDEAGGYLLLSHYHRVVKSGVGYPDHMPEDHGPMVYGAVNALQRTPWQVNRTVLEAMEQVWAADSGIAGIPNADDLVIPERFENEGDDSEWRAIAERYHRHNARLVGKRLSFLQTMEVARCCIRDTFYFPYQCDFRGRIYPIPQFLQPQGNDVARGLLMFADAKPLGKRGLWWLRVQYANCWGMDKVSFGERVGWANDKVSSEINAESSYPSPVRTPFEPDWLGTARHLWADADDPWQALATVIEIWRAYRCKDPTTYECALPVNVDGSNSGLQHFSAMLRDPHGARLVNLTATEHPSDIYSDVARCVLRDVQADEAERYQGRTEAPTLIRRWLGEKAAQYLEGRTLIETVIQLPKVWLAQGLGRKLCKRGTMTYCYGVTLQGLKEALIQDGFLDWADKDIEHYAVSYIGGKIWACIQENITGASEAMDWLRKCATCANKADVLLEWRTPSGFHVAHPYNQPLEQRIQCLSGEVRFKVHNPEGAVRGQKQRNSLPPNFVHSLDASHLILTTASAVVNGITHFMMIHDSFGTHAGQVDLLRDVLREQFVQLYTIDVLADFRQQVIDQTGHDPGPPPERGDFDIEEVHDSEYIFA